MRSNWTRFPTLALAALSLVLWSCDDLGETTGPLAPGAAAHSDGTVSTVKYNIAKGSLTVKTKENSQVIQPNAGGDIGLEGNVVIVPSGAVSEPTQFRMRFSSTDGGTTKAQFELRAFQKDSKGDYTVDVGPSGFLKPVRLRLRYDWITDAVPAENFRIVWVKGDGSQEVYSTELDSSGKTLTTYLNHFSDYAVGYPNSETPQ